MSPAEIADALAAGSDGYKPEHLPPMSIRALMNLADGLSSDYGLQGRSAFGGHNATIRSLARQGLVRTHHERGITLSDAGRLAVKRIVAKVAARGAGVTQGSKNV